MQAAAILPSIPTVQAPPPPPDEPVADANGFADVMDQTDVAPAPETVGDPPTETAPDGLKIEGEAPTTPGTPVIGQPPPYWPALPAPLLALLPEAAAVPTAPPLVAGPEGGLTDALIPDAPRSPSAPNADPRIVAQPGLSGLAPSGPTGAPDTGPVIAAEPPDTSDSEAVINQLGRQQLAAPPAVGPPTAPAQAQIPAFWSLHLADPVARSGEKLPADAESVATTSEGGETVTPTLQPVAGALLSVDGSGAPDMLAPPQSSSVAPGSVPQGAATPGAPAQTPVAAALPPGLSNDLAALISARPDGPVDLQLFPEELGHLRLSLTQDGDILRVTIQAERAETLDLLRRHADTLMEEIRMAGFSGGTFNFSGWQGPAPDARQSPEHASFAETADPAPPLATRLAHSGLDLRL
jgi:hypothetical protein